MLSLAIVRSPRSWSPVTSGLAGPRPQVRATKSGNDMVSATVGVVHRLARAALAVLGADDRVAELDPGAGHGHLERRPDRRIDLLGPHEPQRLAHPIGGHVRRRGAQVPRIPDRHPDVLLMDPRVEHAHRDHLIERHHPAQRIHHQPGVAGTELTQGHLPLSHGLVELGQDLLACPRPAQVDGDLGDPAEAVPDVRETSPSRARAAGPARPSCERSIQVTCATTSATVHPGSTDGWRHSARAAASRKSAMAARQTSIGSEAATGTATSIASGVARRSGAGSVVGSGVESAGGSVMAGRLPGCRRRSGSGHRLPGDPAAIGDALRDPDAVQGRAGRVPPRDVGEG